MFVLFINIKNSQVLKHGIYIILYTFIRLIIIIILLK